MRTIHFPNWPEILSASPLPGRMKHSFEITIRWHLGFCRRGRSEVHVQSARDFIAWATAQKQPQPWQLEDWKEAIRWFFLAAKEQSAMETAPDGGVWLPDVSQNWPEWKVAFLTTLRRRKYSYRTEQSYLVWVERFAAYLGTHDLRSQAEAEITAFLDSLALNEQLSASSQRQALNALVFLFRDVFERKLGDFSDYRRARVRPHLPTWLTPEELERFFACLGDEERLLAEVMYGGGLRLMELLRLRVKDLDLEQEIITVRGGVQNGYDLPTVQELLGHAKLETTQIYTHVLGKPGLGVKSPLDR